MLFRISVRSEFRLFGYVLNGGTYFSPILKPVGFVNVDVDVEDDKDVTRVGKVRAMPKLLG